MYFLALYLVRMLCTDTNPSVQQSVVSLYATPNILVPQVDQGLLDAAVLQDATERISAAATRDRLANDTYENILNLDAATEAEIKAEASRRVAEAAAKIASDEEAKARSFAGLIKVPVVT